MTKTLAMPPTCRFYVKPAVLRAALVEFERIAADRVRTGQPLPSDQDIGDWIGFDKRVICAVRKYIEKRRP